MVSPLQSKKTASANNASTFRLLHKHFKKPQGTVCGQLSPDAVHPRVSAAVIQFLDLRVLYGGTVFGYLPSVCAMPMTFPSSPKRFSMSLAEVKTVHRTAVARLGGP
jgi:hypothetical protein